MFKTMRSIEKEEEEEEQKEPCILGYSFPFAGAPFY